MCVDEDKNGQFCNSSDANYYSSVIIGRIWEDEGTYTGYDYILDEDDSVECIVLNDVGNLGLGATGQYETRCTGVGPDSLQPTA